jgi:predicted amino acid racemase
MSKVIINLDALKHNLSVVGNWMETHGAHWITVIKALCGHEDTLRALHLMGVRSVGDSRLENLQIVANATPGTEAWYLRGPSPTAVDDVARLASGSLNSEIHIIEQLNRAARALDRTHGIIIMVELGDLREGILPGSLVKFYEQVFELPNIDVVGVGANLGCLAGAVPTIDQLMQLALYRELLELKFKQKLPFVSAGTTAVLPLFLDNQLPKAINHFRIGEALFLGTDLINGGTLPYLRNDVVRFESEISEIKEKGLVPLAETAQMSRFNEEQDELVAPGQRGYRALMNVGYLDTDVTGLTPVDDSYRIAGASSDITVVNLGDEPDGLKVGDTISFKVNYSALLRLMSSKYINRVVDPPIDEFAARQAEVALMAQQAQDTAGVGVGADRI